MIITTHKRFNKHFSQRIKSNHKLLKKFNQRLSLFINSPKHPLLKDHSLKGSQLKHRSLSITGDIRLIYRKKSVNHIQLLDIGSHNQVY